MGIENVRAMLQQAGLKGVTATADPEPLPTEPNIGDAHRYQDGTWAMWDGTEWFQIGKSHE